MAKTLEQQISGIARELRQMRSDMQKIVGIINADLRTSDRLISVREAARILNRSTDYIYDLIHSGRLGSRRDGPRGRHSISENEIRRYLSS